MSLSRLASRVRHAVGNYFFEPMAPTTLGVARIIIFGLYFWKSLSRPWERLAEVPPMLLWRTAVPDLPYVTSEALMAITVGLGVFSLMGMLGRLPRLSASVCFVLLYLLNAIDGGIYDSGWILISFLLVLSASRCGDALVPGASRAASAPSWEYRWPLRVIQLSLIIMYFQNGVGKLAASGLAWTDPNVLQSWFLWHDWVDGHHFRLGTLLLEYPLLARLGGYSTLVLEVGVILLPFFPSLRFLFIPGLIGMHATIGITLNIWFTEYFPLLLLFFDWEGLRAFRRSRGERGRSSSPTARAPG